MSDPAAAGERHLDIRKYPNRRYYDATHSRHLTLEEIRSLIREGYDISVTDSKTGADLTAQVLTQIILELETPKIDSFPVALLLRMIRSNDQAVRDFVENYFNQAFRAFVDYQKQMEERLRQMPMTGMFPPFGAWAQTFSPFLSPLGSAPGAAGEKPPTPPSPPAADQPAGPAPQADLRATVDDLRHQLAALRSELRTARNRTAPPRRPASRRNKK